jgi:hypothetical protein
MGSRLLRQWLEHPLLSAPEIMKRQNTIESFLRHIPFLQKLRDEKQFLKGFPDLNKIIFRIKNALKKDSESISSIPFVPERSFSSSSLHLLKDLLEVYKSMIRITRIRDLLKDIEGNLISLLSCVILFLPDLISFPQLLPHSVPALRRVVRSINSQRVCQRSSKNSRSI